MFGSIPCPCLTPTAVSSPREAVNPHTVSQLRRSQAGASRCEQHRTLSKTAHFTRALRISPNLRATGGKESYNFTSQYVSCVGERGSVTGRLGGVIRNEDESWLPHPSSSLRKVKQQRLLLWLIGRTATWISSPAVTYDVTYYSLSSC